MPLCDNPIRKLFNYLMNLETNSTDNWKLFLKMLQENKKRIVSSSPDHLNELLMILLLGVGCEHRNTAKRILSICCGGHFNFKINPMAHLDLMNSAFRNADVQLMAVLVKYGFIDTTALRESEVEFERAKSAIVKFRSHAVSKDWLSINNEEEFISHLTNLMDDMRRSCLQQSVFQRGVRRILLLTRILSIFLEVNGKLRLEQQVQCIKLFFTAIPDPFVSLDELLTFLEIIFNREMNVQGQTSIAGIYKSFFPFEASSQYQPRSLQHLCRCSVRKVYGKQSKTLPVLFKRMWIPETLKDFLLL